MICKVNYTDNPDGKIDDTIECSVVVETSKLYAFRDCFGVDVRLILKQYVETIVIG